MIKDGANLVHLSDRTPEYHLNDSAWRDVFRDRPRRTPPLTPQKFTAFISKKTVTNGGSMDFIKECYNITFAEVVSKATTLWFANLEWEDSEADVLLELAPFCDDLQLLIVSRNQFSGAACMRLIK